MTAGTAKGTEQCVDFDEFARCSTQAVPLAPFLPICRSQQDVRISGDWRKLLDEARDSHWAMAYGDWLKECGFAAARAGVRWESIV
jgi:hypothetical protein